MRRYIGKLLHVILVRSVSEGSLKILCHPSLRWTNYWCMDSSPRAVDIGTSCHQETLPPRNECGITIYIGCTYSATPPRILRVLLLFISGQSLQSLQSWRSGDANTSANCTMPFDSKEFTGVALLRAATGSISFLCALCSILLIVAYKRYLLSFQRVALYFCIASADATNRVDYTFTNSDTLKYCVWAGFFTQYALWTLFLLIVCFVTCSMGKVVFQMEHVRLERC